MKLNFLYYALISIIPILIGWLWYNPRGTVQSFFKLSQENLTLRLGGLRFVWLYLMSLALCFGFINLVIHQVGYYELFFTDIMMGSEEAVALTQEFLAEYGDKHRHFMHGVFHGGLLSVFLALPFISLYGFLHGIKTKTLVYHYVYWLLTCTICCGLISEFV